MEDLVGGLRTSRAHPAYLALSALNTVAAPQEREVLERHLASTAATSGTPSWAARTAGAPSRAWRAADPWESVVEAIIAFEEPEPHDLLVRLSTVGGRMVNTILLLDPGARDRWPKNQVDMPLVEARSTRS